MPRRCAIDVYLSGAFRAAADVELLSDRSDHEAPTFFEYDIDYVGSAMHARDHRAVSVRYPVNYGPQKEPSFPAFLMDMMPQGEARRQVAARLRAEGGGTSDWDLLLAGARNPVGNLRVAAAVTPGEESGEGVDFADIVARGDDFRDWAESQRIPMTGSSDTGGASPKLLMTADAHGRFHADGALPDARAVRHYIIKFPRGRKRRDAAVLANEAPYLEVLRALGLRCGDPLHHDQGTLLVPRFDRQRVDGGIERLGMESAYSFMGVAGARLAFEDVCVQLASVVREPQRDVIELLLRDAAALALGNPDNHGRNTSLLKHVDGRVELSPVYDFAPMFLDPELITRTTRWRSERGSAPDWNDVVNSLAEHLPSIMPREVSAPVLRAFGEQLAAAPDLMRNAGVDADIIEQRAPHIQTTSAALAAVEGG